MTYSVEVSVGVDWHVVVDHNVHMVNIYSSSEDVGSHHYSLLEFLESSVSGKSKRSHEGDNKWYRSSWSKSR